MLKRVLNEVDFIGKLHSDTLQHLFVCSLNIIHNNFTYTKFVGMKMGYKFN